MKLKPKREKKQNTLKLPEVLEEKVRKYFKLNYSKLNRKHFRNSINILHIFT